MLLQDRRVYTTSHCAHVRPGCFNLHLNTSAFVYDPVSMYGFIAFLLYGDLCFS